MMNIDMRCALVLAVSTILGCLGPRVEDVPIDAKLAPDASFDARPDAAETGLQHVLPAGATVPSVATNAALVSQIQINDGLSDSALAANMGVLARSSLAASGKAAGATVRFWNFGALPMAGSFAVSPPVYILANSDGAGGYTPIAGHPMLIDSIPGDDRYSAIRREVYVPISPTYAGELLTSIDALAEALNVGLVLEPVPKGTWRNLPVVPPATRLEVGPLATDTAPTTEVYARGYRVELFVLGGAIGVQPLRNNGIPIGQESRLLSGVATGIPPSKPVSPDAQPVFQYGIPAAPPTTAFNYTPLVTQLDVRLADGIAPATITSDAQLFVRSASGGITGYLIDNVESYVVTTTLTNKQIQFVEGSP